MKHLPKPLPEGEAIEEYTVGNRVQCCNVAPAQHGFELLWCVSESIDGAAGIVQVLKPRQPIVEALRQTDGHHHQVDVAGDCVCISRQGAVQDDALGLEVADELVPVIDYGLTKPRR